MRAAFIIIAFSLCLILSLTSCKSSSSAKAQQEEFLLKVEGEVQNPGVYPFHDGDTIQVAIARAGGFYQWPSGSGILEPHLAIITSEKGKRVVVKRKEWSKHKVKAGDKVYINRNWL
jgi:SLBB domain